jgi:hypothetical protein
MDDRAALQYHNAVGQPQNLLRVLLDNNRADAPRTGNGAERAEQFLDDDRGEPLGRLSSSALWMMSCTADRQLAPLAAGELVAEFAALSRRALVTLSRSDAAGCLRGHVLFHRQRAEDIALLRNPADTRRALVRPSVI